MGKKEREKGIRVCRNFGLKISKKNEDKEGGLEFSCLFFHDSCFFGTITLSDARRRNRAIKL